LCHNFVTITGYNEAIIKRKDVSFMKKLFIITGVIVALTVPLAAWAATSNNATAQAFRGYCGIDPARLTAQQKADLTNQWQKMRDLKKATVNQMVANGAITKEQGELAVKRIESRMRERQDKGFFGNCGPGNGSGGGRRSRGHGWDDGPQGRGQGLRGGYGPMGSQNEQ
jgi:hypothetical protein